MVNPPGVYKFKNGDKVRWSTDTGLPAGRGTVIGISSNSVAVLGAGYIIHPDKRIPGYDYDAIVLFENVLIDDNLTDEQIKHKRMQWLISLSGDRSDVIKIYSKMMVRDLFNYRDEVEELELSEVQQLAYKRFTAVRREFYLLFMQNNIPIEAYPKISQAFEFKEFALE